MVSVDCILVLIGDLIGKCVVVIYVGWWGIKVRIVFKIIDKFLVLGSELKDLWVVLGLAIVGEVY